MRPLKWIQTHFTSSHNTSEPWFWLCLKIRGTISSDIILCRLFPPSVLMDIGNWPLYEVIDGVFRPILHLERQNLQENNPDGCEESPTCCHYYFEACSCMDFWRVHLPQLRPSAQIRSIQLNILPCQGPALRYESRESRNQFKYKARVEWKIDFIGDATASQVELILFTRKLR